MRFNEVDSREKVILATRGNTHVAELETKRKKIWESEEGIRLFKSRLSEDEPLDVVCDRILVQEVERGTAVIDSWSLPWLTDKGIKIYLKADLEIRAQRV
ncbi:MAG: hypothetical protein Q7K43_04130, partial [Candidatus Woesearchaeota archaeon]|nr:hypothetical protein [Candidatus Woesearchaeota archaeon]